LPTSKNAELTRVDKIVNTAGWYSLELMIALLAGLVSLGTTPWALLIALAALGRAAWAERNLRLDNRRELAKRAARRAVKAADVVDELAETAPAADLEDEAASA
jgi:hypothetical protein